MPGDFDLPNLIDDLDLELDFDLSDFTLIGTNNKDDDGGLGDLGDPQARVFRPRIDIRGITHHLTFANARAFAQQIDLSEHARTYAWIDGSFVFGDVIEALVYERHMIPEEIYISSLSLNQENIDSLKNILLLGTVRKLYILLSAYFFSHEKYDLVPYLYQELDIGDILQVAFINCHSKIIAIRTVRGNTLTIHGSSNLRSSNSIEQIMIERDPELYEYNAGVIRELTDTYATINHSISRTQSAGSSLSYILDNGISNGGAEATQDGIDTAIADNPRINKDRYKSKYYTRSNNTFGILEQASNQFNNSIDNNSDNESSHGEI